MKKILLTIVLLLIASPLLAKEEIIFSGVPEVVITVNSTEQISAKFPKEEASEVKCIISKVNDKYYWTTRENTELIRFSNGAYITFWASNGSGYVRILKPEYKEEIKKHESLSGVLEGDFDYVENHMYGLRSIIYYGKSK
jgi:hypothetical protein